MRVLVDTNVLLRSVQKGHPACRLARLAIAALYRGDHEVFIATQNVSEFWNVCTRPLKVNGLGLSIEKTDRYTDQLGRLFTILPDSMDVFQMWRKLVVTHAVVGSKVHDARLVAVMMVHGISQLVTFNTGDFARFPGIEAVDPERFG